MIMELYVSSYTAVTTVTRRAIPIMTPAANGSASTELLGCAKQRGFPKQSSSKIHIDLDLHREHISTLLFNKESRLTMLT